MEKSCICGICAVNECKYSCPKCHIGYCSVACYQSSGHSQCSEDFYRQWVLEDMKNCQSDPEATKRMLKLLKDAQEGTSEDNLDSDDDYDTPDLANRMKDVNLDDEETVWEKLTVEERQEFRKLVATGKIVEMLPEWEPWWKTKKRKGFIQECDVKDDWKDKCPPVPSEIPELTNLTKVNPSPNVPYMLLNVLISYIYTVRWFKGEHKLLPLEAISTCVILSATLRDNQVFTSPIEAFLAFEKDLTECKWVSNKYDRNQMKEDLVDIIKGSYKSDMFFCLKAAICDLKLMCSQALVTLRDSKTNHLKRFSGPPLKVTLLNQISKKMNYYLSWTVSYGNLLSSISNLM